ncbi:hypothetical protein ACFWPQ_38285 [Streptomyces sp. NPDC058464]|uniref:hypothetical protein n=1 Tax=Streptomyces sp. NPDC058464 TaxID=3346511 RepID=UPI0036488AB6
MTEFLPTDLRFELPDEAVHRLYPRRLFVEPTLNCDVGCTFCKYSPVPRGVGDARRMSLPPSALDAVVRFSASHPLEELIITGGGEPTYEMTVVAALLNRTFTKNVSLYTAGQWARTAADASEMLRSLIDLSRSGVTQRSLTIRLSVDRFHARTLGDEILGNIVSASRAHIGCDSSVDVSYEVRTILGQETYVEDLIRRLGGSLRDAGRGSLSARVGDLTFPVTARGIVPLGRMRLSRARRIQEKTAAELLEAYEYELGGGWPMLYKGGWNAGVRWSGDVYLYGGMPLPYGNVSRDGTDFSTSFRRMAEDPLNYIGAVRGFKTVCDLLLSAGLLTPALMEDLHDPSTYVPITLADPGPRMRAQIIAAESLARSFADGDESEDRSARLIDTAKNSTEPGVQVALGGQMGTR